jgi:tetratricopeptide (TPR) repeat protein/NAD-dependent SIR2 family protein deacetylase
MSTTASDHLREVLRGRQAVLLCGAGISLDPPAGLPDWHELRDRTLAAVAGRHAQLVAHLPALTAVEMLAVEGKRGLTPEVVASEIARRCEGYFESFQSLEDGEPNANHRWIAAAAGQGALRYVVTTNFDVFLERAFEEASVAFAVHRTDQEFEELDIRSEDPLVHVLKLHGCISRPETITATVEHEAVGLNPAKARALDRLLPGRWLVVWGYSGADLKIDVDYLRMVSCRDETAGFVWNLHAEGSFREEPNSYVAGIVQLYGGRGRIAHDLLPKCFDAVTPTNRRPARAPFSGEERKAWQEGKNERLATLLGEWAKRRVDPRVACLIIGELLEHSELLAEALECFEELERLSVAAGDKLGETTALGSAAGVLWRLGRQVDATLRLRRMDEIARSIEDPSQLAWALRAQAEHDSAAGRLEEAFTGFREAEAIVRMTGHESARARLLVELAKLQRGRGRFEDALAFYGEAESVSRALGERHLLGEVLRGKADLLIKWGELDNARDALEEARHAAVLVGHRPSLAAVLFQLASVHLARKEVAEARSCLVESRHYASASGDPAEEAMILGALSFAAGIDEKPTEALALAEEAIVILRKPELERPRDLGIALVNLAMVQIHVSANEDAAASLREALPMLRSAGDHFNAARASRELARLHAERSEHEDALAHFEWAIALFRAAGHPGEVPGVLRELSPVLAALRGTQAWDLADVLVHAAEASGVPEAEVAALAQGMGASAEASRIDLAAHSLETQLGREEAAVRLAVEIKGRTDTLQAAADYSGIMDLSRLGYELARAIGDDHMAGVFLNDAAVASSSLGDEETGRRLYEGAIHHAETLGDQVELSLRLANLATMYRRVGRADDAFKFLGRAEAAAGQLLDGEMRLARFRQVAEEYERLHAWDDSGRCFTEVLKQAAVLGDLPALGRARQGRGKAFRELGRHADAARERETAAHLYAATGEDSSAAAMAALAAQAYQRELHRPEEAAELFEMAILHGERAGFAEVVTSARAGLAEFQR